MLRNLNLIEVLTLVELFLQEVEVRLDILRTSSKPSPDIQPSVDTLLYVAPRIGIAELQQVLECSNEMRDLLPVGQRVDTKVWTRLHPICHG